MNYTHLDSAERRFIAQHHKSYSQRWIARVLGRSPSTICRELSRNHDRQGGPGHYKAKRAEERASGRRMRRRDWSWFCAGEWRLVWRLLGRKFSPEQIVLWLRRHAHLRISHETIYRRIWDDKARGGVLFKHLRQAGKLRRKRYGAYDSRGRLAGKRALAQRPAGARNRSRLGHWEIDTVVGPGPACILTLVDRRSGYVHIRKLEEKTVDETNYRLACLLRRHPGEFRTITADNGTEFHGYREIEGGFPVRFYFAAPYHSWERGSSENANGLIRQFIPKRTCMRDLTQAQCDRIAKNLNTRPRKRLGGLTPEEVHKHKATVALQP